VPVPTSAESEAVAEVVDVPADGADAGADSGDPGIPVWTTSTCSPGVRPPAGNCPSFSATPTTASPAATAGAEARSPAVRSEPAGTAAAARLPSMTEASATGMYPTPADTDTSACPRSEAVIGCPWTSDRSTTTAAVR
jgi:hypothetical protein